MGECLHINLQIQMNRTMQSGWRSGSLTWDIHCSIQQSALHCSLLFSHCYITNYVVSGLKLSKSQSRSSVYTGQNFSIQIAI